MAKDPAFLFYPGDYLRDTQCLSDKSQVAYDRIMCEHMRNISLDMTNIGVSQERVNFFIKRLSADEKEEIFHVLKKKDDSYQIEWVAESICKRKSYSESRAKNRGKKPEEDMKTYDNHMVIANENDINTINSNKISNSKVLFNNMPVSENFNGLPEVKINASIELVRITGNVNITSKQVKDIWEVFKVQHLTGKKYYADRDAVFSHFINWIKTQKFNNGNKINSTVGKEIIFDKL